MLKQQNFMFHQSPSSFTEDFETQAKSLSLKISPISQLQSLETCTQKNYQFQDIQEQCSILQQKPQTPAVQVIKVKNSNVNNQNNNHQHHHHPNTNITGFQYKNLALKRQVSSHTQPNLDDLVNNGKIDFEQAKTHDGKSSQSKSQLQWPDKNSNGIQHSSVKQPDAQDQLQKNEQVDFNLKDLLKQNIMSQNQQNRQAMIPFPKNNKIAHSRYSQQNFKKNGIEKFKQRQSEEIKKISLNRDENNKNISEKQGKTVKKVNQPIYAPSTVQKFISSPIKQGYMMETLIIIENGFLGFGRKYCLRQKQDNKILCSAKKQMMSMSSQFVLSLGNSHFSKRDSEFIGVMEADFRAKQWNLNCPIIPAKFNEGESCSDLRRVMSLRYQSQLLNSHSFPNMSVAIKDPEGQQNRIKNNATQKLLKIKSEMPSFQNGRYSLDFKGIAKIPSKRNFILQTETGERCLIFGKQKQNIFQMNIRYPLNVLQGFSLCLAILNDQLFIS